MNKKLSALALPLFIFWPFGAFILSLSNLKSKSSAVIWVLFSTIFGYAFAFQFTSADSYRMAMVFDHFNFSSLDDIYYLYRAGALTDLYRYLLYGITKSFTNNPKVLFAFFGFVFGIFSYLSIRSVVIEKGNKQSVYWSIILFIFFTLNPITNINGARFYTAAALFFYSISSFLFSNNKKWMLGILLAPLIHFSFLFATIPVFFFYFFQKIFYNKTKIQNWVFTVFIITFFASWLLETNALNTGFLSEISPLKSVSNKVDLYTSDRITETVNQRRSESLFLRVSRPFSYIIKIYFFLFLIIAKKLVNKMNIPKQNLNKLLSFILFFLSFGYVASSVPSGGRFLTIGYLFTMVLIAKLYYIFPSKKIKKYILWSLPVFSFSILFNIGYLSYALASSTLWYGSVPWIIWEGIGFEFKYIF